ncbi:MAG: YchF family ATPase [Candidatus Pacebacteria bacterium]|nr:YchF family ATPase [Candidatus Paceibacterota bacterium]
MKLSLGIVGLPNVGKSTLFKALTKNDIPIANYPFCTIDPNVGVVVVPDERVDKLAEMSKSKKKIPAVVEFYDIAGLVKGAYKGEGLGNKFLSHIRETNAIVQVLRCFPLGEIVHVENSVDPLRDMEIINSELALKDLETIDKSMSTVEKDIKAAGSASSPQAKGAVKDLEVLKKAKELLSAGKLIMELKDEPIIKNIQLLTAKPQIYLLNGKPEHVPQNLTDKIKSVGADYSVMDLSSPEIDLGDLIRKSYAILNLISFFTTGEDETRAWTIMKGEKAPQAAGTIHTDFEKKFVKAEVINCAKLLEVGGWAKAKQKGVLRLEGKEYVFQDGDVTEIKHG